MLPYGVKIEGLTCALCKLKKNKSDLNHVCFKCLSQHDDNTHIGWDINSEYTRETVLHRSCICGDVVRITIKENIVFEYFKVGQKEATLIPYKCNRLFDRNVEECVHEWIVLGSNTKDINDGYKDLLTMKENPGLKAMGLDDIALFENIAFGSTTSWCYKCGCFYDLSPRNRHLLPKKGYIK